MALIRCSRGGKTRALKEIAFALKERMPDCVVLSVSFSAFSCVQDWEQADPIGALCRRIAFAAVCSKPGSKLTESDYREHFATMIVKDADILSWLEDVPCVLMIDELHRLDGLQSTDGFSLYEKCTTASSVIKFLELNFLMQKNRYFVFSSNVASTVNCVDMYMNYRGIIVRELPLIPHIKDFRRIFEWQDLTINEAIYFGLIPSMLLLKRRGHLSTLGRDSVLTYIKKRR
jgi:hypothetical protein